MFELMNPKQLHTFVKFILPLVAESPRIELEMIGQVSGGELVRVVN